MAETPTSDPKAGDVASFLDELRWRGLLKDCTDPDGLTRHLSDPAGQPRRAYAGFDPTADSLTIGNLVPIMMLVHFARAGHVPVVLMGGGTGLIGDPSGKSAERQLLDTKQISHNLRRQRQIFVRVFKNAGLSKPVIVNNAKWIRQLSAIDLLRDVGKMFSVNEMMRAEAVKNRLEQREQGISYTEFSYPVLQAYDFAVLNERRHFSYKQVRGIEEINGPVTIQMGGSDQWGNITFGVRLINQRRAFFEAWGPGNLDLAINPSMHTDNWRSDLIERQAFGLTAPLVAKADGGKFGKSEAGAVWLSAPKTTAYAMYQFWLNAADADAIKFLKLFTLLSRERIEEIERAHDAEPHKREAQKILAMEATSLVHGREHAEAAERAGRALFSGEIADLPMDMIEQVFDGLPASDHPRAHLEGDGVSLVDVLSETSLAKSKREAREFLASGSVSVNGIKADAEAMLTTADLLHGKVIALRRGKKVWHLTRWVT